MSKVTIRVEGLNFGFLIEKLHKKNIEIFTSKKISDKINLLKINLKDEDAFYKITGNTWQCKSVKYSGLKNLQLFFEKNFCYLITILLFAISTFIINGFMFNINVVGLDDNLAGNVIEYLYKDYGLKRFEPFYKIDCKDVGYNLIKQFDVFDFVTVKKQGQELKITIIKGQRQVENKKISTISSNVNGKVIKIDVAVGKSLVSVGDDVMFGDSLIVCDNSDFVLGSIKVLSQKSYILDEENSYYQRLLESEVDECDIQKISIENIDNKNILTIYYIVTMSGG